MGSCVPSRDIPRFIAMFRQGRLPIDRLLSSTGPLDEINAAFDRLDQGEVVRHVILMWRGSQAAARASPRVDALSRTGGSPNILPYSRVNCGTLS